MINLINFAKQKASLLKLYSANRYINKLNEIISVKLFTKITKTSKEQ